MLASLSIRNIVLIDRLDLNFEAGLCVLTGETGAGKSILLDSLALALGARADLGLIRAGEDKGSVTATFSLPNSHPAFELLQDIEREEGEPLILRRIISSDGRNRASINDQSVSTGLLRSVGETLVEIHGQNAERGLLDARGHRALLDLYGRLEKQTADVSKKFLTFEVLSEQLTEAEEALEKARVDEEYLRHVVDELEALNPCEGEEEELSASRAAFMHAEKIAEALKDAQKALNDHGGVDGKIRNATRAVERVVEKASGKLDPVLDSLERAAIELSEASMTIEAVTHDLNLDQSGVEQVEERLFSLRAAARKHKCEVSALPNVLEQFRERLATVEHGDAEVKRLQLEVAAARKEYELAAGHLRDKRIKSASKLDAAVMAELGPLRLGAARFMTAVTELAPDQWSASGMDRVEFQIATNPGSNPGPLIKIASGGELSRFMLALKVVLAQSGSAPTLIFDEVDRGVGGATADAVGERLSRLAEKLQLLVITHSPQVAAAGQSHWNIQKMSQSGSTRTTVERLEDDERREEIARMLSGASITNEARAAAVSLMEG
ncbi:DNA repair protein RecN [Sneathiella glossodoripedis]|uniref:DNA repair protein RecN n=1 Tax=Sneathiella glossodoripedis TaxID=418853 RepID=UPI000472F836|nr:DNA repair protein RecN [Sneathiella glossodoripedis]